MDLEDLHLAVVIAREGSLAAASVALGISQPTLSKAVARLERATGVRLFERQARGMRPTELGQAFLDRASVIDLAAADLHAAMRDLRQARSGVLSFGLGHGVPDRWLLPVIRPLVANGVHIDLSGGMTDSLLRAVAQGQLAFAVVGMGDAPGGTLTWLPLRDDPMLPLAPKGRALAQALRDPGWRQLAQARWIVPASGTPSFEEFERNFADHGLAAPQPCVASRSSQRELSLATALDALVLVPRSVADEPAVRAAFAAVKPPGGWRSSRRMAVVHRTAGYLSPAAMQAIGLLRESVEAALR